MKLRLLPCLLAFAACDDGADPMMDPIVDARVRTIGGDMRVPDAAPDAAPEPEAQPEPQPEGDPEPPPEPEPPMGCVDGEERPCPDGCGVQRCEGEAWGACDAGGAAERCNGADDDCDGAVDESFQGLGIGCSIMVNGCNAQGLFVCNASGNGTECQPTEDVAPEAEVCDGIDNDCDNDVDEDFPDRFCCTEDFHCPNNGTCENGECQGGVDPEPDVLPGFDPAQSCDPAVELAQFGRFEANTLLALPALRGTCGGDGPEAVFWFEFDEDTDVVLTTDGTDYDTVLHVRTDCELAGSEVACDDDGGDGTASQVELRALGGQRYYVVVDAFSLFGGGDAQLGFWPAGEVPECLVDADCGAREACVEAVCERVPAVACAEAVDIEPGQHVGDTAGARDELMAGCGQPSGGEAVYHLRFDRPATVVATTEGSDFDTILSVRTDCEDLATEITCNDDGAAAATSRVEFDALADTDYYLIVDGYDGASGAVALDVSAALGCIADEECEDGFSCEAGECIPPGACEMPPAIEPGRHEGDTGGAQNTFDASCGNGSGGEAAYLLRFDAPTPVTLTTDGSAFDTILSVRTVCDDVATEVACDDDSGEGTRSLVEFDALADTDYFVFVDGYNGQSGAYVLDVSVPGPPPEPECDDATPCPDGEACINGACVIEAMCVAEPVGAGATMGTTAGGVNNRAPGCGLAGDAPDVIYAFVALEDADVTVDTSGSAFDTILTVLDADCDTELFCDDDGGVGTTSSITFPAAAGQLYYVVVDGYNAASGAFTLTVSVD